MSSTQATPSTTHQVTNTASTQQSVTASMDDSDVIDDDDTFEEFTVETWDKSKLSNVDGVDDNQLWGDNWDGMIQYIIVQ